MFRSETKVGAFVLIALVIFSYMAFHLGVFKLYLKKYKPYTIYFNDLNGLEKKSDIKIAGVKVGWVDDIQLDPEDNRAKVRIMVQDKCCLYSDAFAAIHQDGLLGTKYLDLDPGNNQGSLLKPGDTFNRDAGSRASIDDIMQRFEKIAKNVEEVSETLKGVLCSKGRGEQLSSIIDNINEASKKIAAFTDVLTRNEHNIEQIFNNLQNFTRDVAPIGKDIHRAANIFDKNFTQLSSSLDETLKNINSIAQKINDGKGLLGKLINEDEICDDLKSVVSGFRQMSEMADKTGIVFDSHFESMTRPAEHYNHPDSKGYFDVRLFTREDLFYMFQLIGTEKGNVLRSVDYNKVFDSQGKLIKRNRSLANFGIPPKLENTTITRNSLKIGLQVGKVFKDLGLRFGIFENSAGVGIDYEIPLCSDYIRWVTTLEAFDFRGQDRINDRSPHLKWLNRVFFLRNIYFDFGADDFISKHNANAFFGFGLRFSDDDIKYLIGRLGCLTGFLPSVGS